MAEVYPDVRAIFCEAVELQSADEVARYLDGVCGDNVSLRLEVLALLGSHQDAGNFLGGASSAETIEQSPIAERPGTLIGPYKLMEQIGEGGFGVVFLAEQERPVRRRVGAWFACRTKRGHSAKAAGSRDSRPAVAGGGRERPVWNYRSERFPKR